MVRLALWGGPGKKVQEKAPSEKLLEREKAGQPEGQVLEEQGEQKEAVLAPLELQVSPEQEVGLPAPEFVVAMSPLCLPMNELPSGPVQRVPPFLRWQPAFSGHFRLAYFSFELLNRNTPGSRISAKG